MIYTGKSVAVEIDGEETVMSPLGPRGYGWYGYHVWGRDLEGRNAPCSDHSMPCDISKHIGETIKATGRTYKVLRVAELPQEYDNHYRELQRERRANHYRITPKDMDKRMMEVLRYPDEKNAKRILSLRNLDGTGDVLAYVETEMSAGALVAISRRWNAYARLIDMLRQGESRTVDPEVYANRCQRILKELGEA